MIIKFWQSLSGQLLLRHIIVAMLTSLIAIVMLGVVFALNYRYTTIEDIEWEIQTEVGNWMIGQPSIVAPAGFGFFLVVSAEDKVLYYSGDTPCRMDVSIRDCAPHLTNLTVGQSTIEYENHQAELVVIDSIYNHRLIGVYPDVYPPLTLTELSYIIRVLLSFAPASMALTALLMIPIAFVIASLTAIPLGRRLTAIAKASQRFAQGDLTIRVNDRKSDTVGMLGQQFDSMADVLGQNITILRQLAQKNAQLNDQIEHDAIQMERLRLSRDLHDSISQQLFSLSISAEALPALLRADATKAEQQASFIAQLGRQTLREVRELLIEMRPINLKESSLPSMLKRLCEDWQAAHHLAVDCIIMLKNEVNTLSVKRVVYYITKESLNNIVKHAQATAMTIQLTDKDGNLILCVTDDGQGFTPNDRADSLGIIGMRERAASIGGTLTVRSTAGEGTTVQFMLPLQREG